MENIVILLMQSRTLFHLLHLRSRSYSEHVALGELYDSINGHVDTIVEDYQGYTGKILNISNIPSLDIDSSSVEGQVRSVMQSIEDFRTKIDEDNSTTQNIIDEIIHSFRSTLYKLTFLK